MTEIVQTASRNEDLEHLRLLAIFFKVVAGLAALFSLFPVLHLVMGLMMLAGGFFATAAEGPEGLFMSVFGLFFTLIPLVLMAGGFVYAVFMFKTSGDLVAHRNYTRCLVVAAISCCFFPFGTVLGVFTLLVLLRPSVKALFGVETASPDI